MYKLSSSSRKGRSGHFRCLNCGGKVISNRGMATAHRNHCNFCLWSKHADEAKAGDRKAKCLGGMLPKGLTFKQEGQNKYGKVRYGELMIIHECEKCKKISINRIAGDDNENQILETLDRSANLDSDKIARLRELNIIPLGEGDAQEVRIQLFGKQT